MDSTESRITRYIQYSPYLGPLLFLSTVLKYLHSPPPVLEQRAEVTMQEDISAFQFGCKISYILVY